MENENPIRTLGDYSRPSHEGYRNTIELPDGNNVVPLRSDTIRLVQNGCSFHGLRSEDPNQHLKGSDTTVVDVKEEVKNRTDNEDIRSIKEKITGEEIKELVKIPRSQPIGYYLKHKINKELIEGLIGNQRTYIQRNPQKENNKKEDMEGNFMIPCNVGGLKYMDALVDQGFDVNVMPLSIYNRLTNEKPVGTNIRLSIASHSYIFPLGIAEDVLVEIAGYVYLVDFMILDVKEDKKKPFILGTPFLTIAKAEIMFDKGTITLESGKNKINFFKIPESPRGVKVDIKNDIDLVAPLIPVEVFGKSQIKLFFVYKDPIFESQDMSTSNTHQQSLADAGSETRPPMLERCSYIPWASRFRRYLNRKRENKKWLNKAIDEGPYEFRTFTTSNTEAPRMQKQEDLKGDYLKHYKVEIEAMNLILISIPK
ncbi:MAK10-like protein [Tanacetum coccineum]